MLKIRKDREIEEALNRDRREEIDDPLLLEEVQEIVMKVRVEGLKAALYYTERFDGVKLKEEDLLVTGEEFHKAERRVEDKYREALDRIILRIQDFHRQQRPQSFTFKKDGELLGTMIHPIERVGVYIPGGRNPYPSTLLMTIIPAITAGVKEICITTPPGRDRELNPYLLYTAKRLGVEEILRLGGAQAIASLAFGLKGFKRVDKIVGPGNIYVTLAKKVVYGSVGIDMFAGPSEIAIIADSEAPPHFIARDLLAQAEHDPLSRTILITTHEPLIQKVNTLLEEMMVHEPRKEIIEKALKDQGEAFLVESIEEGLDIINTIGPEHVVLMIRDEESYLPYIKNAGAIFLGAYTPQASGDYFAGPSHVLPTGGSVRFSSPLGVEDFVKRSSIISFTEERIQDLIPDGALLAGLEGLWAHQHSMKVREEESNERDHSFNERE